MGFLVLWVVVFSSFYINICVCDPRATMAALVCANKTAALSDREAYVSNFLAAFDSLTTLVGRQRYGAVIINGGSGNNNTVVYAYGECMKDLSQTDCNHCFAQCKIKILRCFPFVRLTRGGRLFYDGCYLRYDDYMFFNESLSAVDTTVCGEKDYDGGDNKTLFKANVMELVRSLRLKGVKNDGFYTGFVSRGGLKVYGLAQCWEFVNGTACETCLEDSISKIGSCPPKEEGRVLNAGCYLRYSTQKFYNNSDSDTPVKDEEQSRRLATILASTFGGVAFVLVVAIISFIVKKKIMQQRRAKKQLGSMLKTVNKSKLNFSYETLERAANYFADSNKLGQGGSGSVYKGILPDRKTVAIKRLFFNTSQWVDHLFNEINLISGIHHKNLVRLLGCSITGPESLLVYEYVPNQSLDDYLFVKRNVRPLTWEERYKIILGSAQGLAYLHEESKLRIIHRDIKLSNILLDDDFTPKIADFGLCRLFPEDKTHISTAIAGTLGYMAPEYVVRGKLTEKADIYSFGVVLIEVVSGQRNNAFSQNSYSILQKIWNLYGAGKLCEAVDPSLEGRFQEEEASRVLEIGLLCGQAAAETRPSMSIVVKMLTGSHEIPRPTQPPFLNFRSAESVQNKQPDTDLCQTDSCTGSSGNYITESWIEPR